MFGINKNGTKHKIGIIMPAFFPSSRVTYDGGTVEDALDGLNKHSYVGYNNVASRTYTVKTSAGNHMTLITLQHDGGANSWVGIWIRDKLIPLYVSGGAFSLTANSMQQLTITASITYYMYGFNSTEELTITTS